MLGYIMLIYIILFTLFIFVLKLIDWPILKKIKSSVDFNTAVRYRKLLLRNRKVAFFFFVFLIVCFLLYITAEALQNIDDNIVRMFILIGGIFSIGMLYLYLKASNKYITVQGRVSTLTASEFLAANERFVLYLRGFESDVYKEKNTGKWDFSEKVLAVTVKKGLGIPLCAVGMTKEGDSPLGGVRVYIDDKKWEEEVYNLMCKAVKVVILVNDRNSCLLEIRMTKEIYHKCVFVADDLEKYESVRRKLTGIIDLPEIPVADVPELQLEYDPRRFYFTADNVMKDFSGDLSDYCGILGLPDNALSEKDIVCDGKSPFYTKPFFVFLMIIAALNILRMLFEGLF